MHALESLLPDTLLVLVRVWLLLSILFLEKVFSWCLHTEQGFVFRPWLPGLYCHNLCFSFAQTEQVERNYIKEKKAAVKEFEDKKVELKENLIAELEEKKKMIENEKLTMELTGGTKAPQNRIQGNLREALQWWLLSGPYHQSSELKEGWRGSLWHGRSEL